MRGGGRAYRSGAARESLDAGDFTAESIDGPPGSVGAEGWQSTWRSCLNISVDLADNSPSRRVCSHNSLRVARSIMFAADDEPYLGGQSGL